MLTAHGMTIRQENGLLYSSGQLCPGEFSLPGNVSSQYISGLLMALPLLDSGSALTVTGELESAAYVTMTEDAPPAGRRLPAESRKHLAHLRQTALRFPAQLSAEGDWSNAAFFLCMGALSPEGVTVRGLAPASSQGDRAVLNILAAMGARISVENDAVTVRRGELNSVAIDARADPRSDPGAVCGRRRSGGRYPYFQCRAAPAEGI